MEDRYSLISLADNISGLPRPIKLTIAYSSGDIISAHDGQLGISSNETNLPQLNRLSLGFQDYTSDGYLNGHIKRFTYFPNRIDNSKLKSITSKPNPYDRR